MCTAMKHIACINYNVDFKRTQLLKLFLKVTSEKLKVYQNINSGGAYVEREYK